MQMFWFYFNGGNVEKKLGLVKGFLRGVENSNGPCELW